MDRIKRGTPATISNTWTSGATTLDPGTVTIGIAAADGTVVVAPGTATSGSGAAARTFNLTTTHTAKLDRLTATWTSSTQGVDDTIHETVGDFLFTLADARATSGLNATNNDGSFKVADADIRAMRTTVEEALEDACGVAFVPRYSLETRSLSGGWVRTRPKLRTIRSLVIGTTTYSTTDIANLVAEPAGLIYLGGGYTNSSWFSDTYRPGGLRQATIGYEHGYDTPPARVRQAALALAKRWLTGSPADDRATTMVTDEQTTSFYVPRSNEMFDVPLANQVVRQYGHVAVA